MNDSESIFQEYYRSADTKMLRVGGALFLYSFLLAFWFNTWMEAIIVGALIFGGMVVAVTVAPGTRASRIAIGIGFMLFGALHIHQAHGLIEMHFGVFAFMALLLYYRDWAPIVAALATILVHHILFFILQTQGSNVFVVADTSGGWLIILIHAGYACAEAAALIWLSQQSKTAFVQDAEISKAISSITLDETRLDLTIRTSGETTLLERFNFFLETVMQLATQAHSASDKIELFSKDLAAVTTKIYQGTEINQRETTMIATAVEEMSATANEVSTTAISAENEVRRVDENARASADTNKQTVKAIGSLADQIEESSNKINALNEQSNTIGTVLEVIKGIADQTNLLALNAAIEAARAGEQGRGFAVVADEVRTLAQRTQESTEEINTMIGKLQAGSEEAVSAMRGSKEEVSHCVENTQKSLELMQEVSNTIQKINQMNSEIATATREQGNVSNEVSSNICNILTASEDCLIEAEKASNAGNELNRVAMELKELISHFGH